VVKIAATVVALVLVAGVLIFVIAPPCLFYELTGLKCAGCGMTRAARRMLQGDFAGAFRLNAVMVVLTPIVGAGAVISPRSFLKPHVALSLVAVLLAWAVVRNIFQI
jgi:hypothetical protein